MDRKKVIIPKFNSTETFASWWNSPEIASFKERRPGKLEEYPSVKFWLKRVSDEKAQHPTEPVVQKTFGRYLVEQKLGQGGMGAVYLCFDTTLNRKVSLKIMLLDNEEAVERFFREARAAAKLQHPNIVRVHEIDMIDKCHYFTMDYIEGTSFENFVQDPEGAWSFTRAAEIIRDIALALDYAHGSNIIHRDIKPSNILIDGGGKSYLTDFGLAKEIGGVDRALTQSGTIIGTPDYMSPEQSAGNKNDIDHRTDIFSLGSTLYYGLTGRSPFEGEEVYQLLYNVVNEDPHPPSAVNPETPRDLELICMKCLEKNRGARYQTAGELADDLQRFLNNEPISVSPMGLGRKMLRKFKKNKTMYSSIGAVVIILAGVTTYFLYEGSVTASQIVQYRENAKAAFETARYNDAIIACNQILLLVPDDEESTKLLDRCNAIVETELEGARKKEQARNKAKAITDRITAAQHPLPPDERIRLANEALAEDPSFGYAYQVIGYAYKDKGDDKNSLAFFSKAIETDPKLPYSYYERARILARVNDNPDEVMPDLMKVIELDPTSSIGFYAKGCAELRAGKNDEAIVSFTEAIRVFNNYEEAHYKRGLAYMMKRDIPHAFVDFTRAMEINPKNMGAFAQRENLFQGKENGDELIDIYGKILELVPNHPVPLHKRGTLYAMKGDYEKAVADWETCLKFTPNYQYKDSMKPILEKWKKQTAK